jgi:phosphatidate cytidylyltransferase
VNNFWARTITGLSMVFILIAALYLNEWMFAAIFLAITVLGLWEFYGLVTSERCSPQKYFGTFTGIILYLAVIWVKVLNRPGSFLLPDWMLFSFPFLTMLPLGLLFISFIVEIYRKKPDPLVNVSVTVIGVLYIALPLALLNLLDSGQVQHFSGLPSILTGYFILTWFYDTGAYLYGKQFGKHKFFERISPKKTWEGTIAGAVVAFLTATGLYYLAGDVPLVDWYMLTIIVLIFGTFGDLAESLFKRSLNIKDSGTILPGHGGILDRFDTLFISAPFVFLYFFLRHAI